MRIRATAAILVCGLLGGFAVEPSDAGAFRERFKHEGLLGKREEWLLEPGKTEPLDLEGACGAAFSSGDGLYVADYYHRAIGLYASSGFPIGGFSLPGSDEPDPEINTTNAICGLAADPGGTVYGNEFHQAVLRLSPSEGVIDPGQATGVAVGDSGDLYVDRRTYVAVYDAPVEPGELLAEKIGFGSLGDAYGVAVDSASGTVYVADAADGRVKGFVPAVSLTVPQVSIEHEFRSLVDAAIAVDPTNGHVLVVDNPKPGFEDPEAVIFEFDASGAFLDRLSSRIVGPPGQQLVGPIFGEPSGIAVDPGTGHLYVTTGNSDESNVVKYGAFEASAPPAPLSDQSSLPFSSGSITTPGAASATGRVRPPAASTSVVVQRGRVRVSVDGKLTPHALPRQGVAPVGISVGVRIGSTDGAIPPQLRKIAIAINRNGRFTPRGLATCRLHEIQPSTSAGALAACGEALVGEGRFSANVKLPEQSPFPSAGKVLAFNGRLHGRPAILAHIYGTQPAPTSYVLPFEVNDARGTYGTVLETSLPQATGEWGYVTGLEMKLRRLFRYRGQGRSYLSAGCPAPPGFPGAVFPLARTSFAFAGGMTLVSVLNRSCRASH